MQRPHLLGLCLSILAAWMLALSPVAAAKMRASFDPFSVVCSHATTSDDGSPSPSKAKGHSCCVSCHAQAGTFADDGRPVFTVLDYPAASPLRWTLTSVPPKRGPDLRQHPPRGPPSLV